MSQTTAEPVRRTATYEELRAVPEHLVAEILFGKLVTHPRPAPPHAVAASALGHVLGPPFQTGSGGPGGWLFIDEPELHLSEHVAVPDLAAWRSGRLPALPETAWIEAAPDWVCEVLSPSTQRHDRGDKRTIYAEAGIGHLWHVDPILKMLEVFELRDGKWLLVGVFHDDAQGSALPFGDLTFALNLLWPLEPAAATA
jgi:Putative restriction endonuclease